MKERIGDVRHYWAILLTVYVAIGLFSHADPADHESDAIPFWAVDALTEARERRIQLPTVIDRAGEIRDAAVLLDGDPKTAIAISTHRRRRSIVVFPIPASASTITVRSGLVAGSRPGSVRLSLLPAAGTPAAPALPVNIFGIVGSQYETLKDVEVNTFSLRRTRPVDGRGVLIGALVLMTSHQGTSATLAEIEFGLSLAEHQLVKEIAAASITAVIPEKLRQTVDLEGRSLAHVAYIAGGHALLRTALQLGAPGDLPDRSGMTPFAVASSHGDLAAMSILLQHGVDVNERFPGSGQTALHRAVLLEDRESLDFLLQNGADPNTLSSPAAVTNPVGIGELAPLHLAAHSGDRDMIDRLLLAEADAGLANRWGVSPLHIVVQNATDAQVRILQTLLDHGADPETVASHPRFDGKAMAIAKRNGAQEIVAILRRHRFRSLLDTSVALFNAEVF